MNSHSTFGDERIVAKHSDAERELGGSEGALERN
jgi:hypothetical protein